MGRRTAVICAFLLSTLLCMPVGGFVYGLFTGGPFAALVMAILTPLFGGVVPENEAGVGEWYNVWPCIILAWIVLFCIAHFRITRRRELEDDQSGEHSGVTTPDRDG